MHQFGALLLWACRGAYMIKGRSSILLLALLGAVAGFAAAPVFGQAFYGSVVGTNVDQSGGVLHGAAVTLTNVETGEQRQTVSAAGGDYQFLNLVPGMYRVEVEQSGFKKAARDNIEVTVSGAVRADISMRLGAVTESVEVEATAPLLKTEDANLSQVVNTRAVEELPVNGRNIMNLTALVPGINGGAIIDHEAPDKGRFVAVAK